MKLCKLIKKICHGSTSMVVDNVMGNLIEAIHNLGFIRSNDHADFLMCLKVSSHGFVFLTDTGFSIAIEALRDAHMCEFLCRGEDSFYL